MEPVAGESPLRITGELRAPREGAVPIPLLRVPNAEGGFRGVAVDLAGSDRLSVHQARGMDTADT